MKQIKQLGQNFLVDTTAINSFISFCNLQKTDNVLEIGIGQGALTKQIAPKVSKVVGIEIDLNCINYVNNLKIENVQIINANFLNLDLYQTIKQHNINKVVGAIPYYITSPIIHKIITEATTPLQTVYLITQKEFAQKVIDTKKRSYFTNLIEQYGNISRGQVILKTSFNPVPKVDSYFFGIQFKNYPKTSTNVVKWSKFLHKGFATPRKKINKVFDKQKLLQLNIDPNLRPSQLTLIDWQNIYNCRE